MFIGPATNNGLRKLRQVRHGTIRLVQSDMPLLTELSLIQRLEDVAFIVWHFILLEKR